MTVYQVVFPKEPRCPRCGGYDTTAVATRRQSRRQYRRCRAPICREKFCVSGQLVNLDDPSPAAGNEPQPAPDDKQTKRPTSAKKGDKNE